MIKHEVKTRQLSQEQQSDNSSAIPKAAMYVTGAVVLAGAAVWIASHVYGGCTNFLDMFKMCSFTIHQ
jgi:hypothetical protein